MGSIIDAGAEHSLPRAICPSPVHLIPFSPPIFAAETSPTKQKPPPTGQKPQPPCVGTSTTESWPESSGAVRDGKFIGNAQPENSACLPRGEQLRFLTGWIPVLEPIPDNSLERKMVMESQMDQPQPEIIRPCHQTSSRTGRGSPSCLFHGSRIQHKSEPLLQVWQGILHRPRGI